MAKDYSSLNKDDLIKVIEQLQSRKKYGLVWDEERTKEKFEKDSENAIPVLSAVKEKSIATNNNSQTHILIEGDNYHALSVLNYTHQNSVDLIYIDPPYNTGKQDFKYNDKWVDDEDGFKHSKWLSFMSKRLRITKQLLKEDGLFIAHIDEHESSTLNLLLDDIFGEENNLGVMVWDKKNPKGDARGVSAQHEYLFVYAKNASEVFKTEKIQRPKKNALKIIEKANELFARKNSIDIPNDLKIIARKYKLPKELLEGYKREVNLEVINSEFQEWIKKQSFSGGETAYSKIDDNGDVYRLVSMAWPNKKKAPADYFIPLIHPVTGKACPIPGRGWRNPPTTMKLLLDKGLVVFGKDESVQPQRKYLLKENMFENIPSILSFGSSDDSLLRDMDVEFENPKPVEFCKQIIEWFSPKDGIVLDFFAGSGTVAHAVLELNKNGDSNRQAILSTNNELNGNEATVLKKGLPKEELEEYGICRHITYPRIVKAIKGYTNSSGTKVLGLGGDLRYCKTTFVRRSLNKDDLKIKITLKCTEMLCIKEGVYKETFDSENYRIFDNGKKVLAVYYSLDREKLETLKSELKNLQGEKILYCFTLDPLGLDKNDFSDWDDVKLEPIPQKILDIYEEIYEY